MNLGGGEQRRSVGLFFFFAAAVAAARRPKTRRRVRSRRRRTHSPHARRARTCTRVAGRRRTHTRAPAPTAPLRRGKVHCTFCTSALRTPAQVAATHASLLARTYTIHPCSSSRPSSSLPPLPLAPTTRRALCLFESRRRWLVLSDTIASALALQPVSTCRVSPNLPSSPSPSDIARSLAPPSLPPARSPPAPRLPLAVWFALLLRATIFRGRSLRFRLSPKPRSRRRRRPGGRSSAPPEGIRARQLLAGHHGASPPHLQEPPQLRGPNWTDTFSRTAITPSSRPRRVSSSPSRRPRRARTAPSWISHRRRGAQLTGRSPKLGQ